MNIYLLKNYQEHRKGDIITVSNNIAHGLIEGGIGRLPKIKDTLIKTDFGETKALDSAPQKVTFSKVKKKIVS